MNALDDLLADCMRLGIGLQVVEGHGLLIDAPRQALTADLVKRLKANKAKLLVCLDADYAQRASRASCNKRLPDRFSQSGSTLRLCGNGFPPVAPTIPPASIIAIPRVLCSQCGRGRVLPELRKITGGRCYECWTRCPKQ